MRLLVIGMARREPSWTRLQIGIGRVVAELEEWESECWRWVVKKEDGSMGAATVEA